MVVLAIQGRVSGDPRTRPWGSRGASVGIQGRVRGDLGARLWGSRGASVGIQGRVSGLCPESSTDTVHLTFQFRIDCYFLHTMGCTVKGCHVGAHDTSIAIQGRGKGRGLGDSCSTHPLTHPR